LTVDLCYWKSLEPESLFRAVDDEENRRFVVDVMNALTTDPEWTNLILSLVESGRIETRGFVSWLAREMQPKTYLEVGVRRGFSMAMVASRSPDVEVYGFDMWVRNYAGVRNPGTAFVQSELAKVGYTRPVHFVNGNSHKTLPAFFRNGTTGLLDRTGLGAIKQRPLSFDLITIDGDHSLLGAYWDLLDTMPYCAVGGVLVFDDIAQDYSTWDPELVKRERGEDPYGWGDLLGVWHAIQKLFQNFRYFDYTRNPPGVGIAVRLE
jgi:predicted O-methyltransferase YrrM